MKPHKISLDPFTAGDEWGGIPQITIAVGPAGGPFLPPNSELLLVTMRFRKNGSQSEAPLELDSDTEGQISITNNAGWEFSIPPQIIPGLTAGKWSWRIKCVDDSTTGKPKTYFAGELEVLETI